MSKSGSRQTKGKTILLETLSPSVNLIGIPVNRDARAYYEENGSGSIKNGSIVSVAGTEMVVERHNGFVLSGYERGHRANNMSVDLRNQKATLLYLARVETQGTLL